MWKPEDAENLCCQRFKTLRGLTGEAQCWQRSASYLSTGTGGGTPGRVSTSCSWDGGCGLCGEGPHGPAAGICLEAAAPVGLRRMKPCEVGRESHGVPEWAGRANPRADSREPEVAKIMTLVVNFIRLAFRAWENKGYTGERALKGWRPLRFLCINGRCDSVLVLGPVWEIPGAILKRKAKLILNEKENVFFHKHENYMALSKMCWPVNFCPKIWAIK